MDYNGEHVSVYDSNDQSPRDDAVLLSLSYSDEDLHLWHTPRGYASLMGLPGPVGTAKLVSLWCTFLPPPPRPPVAWLLYPNSVQICQLCVPMCQSIQSNSVILIHFASCPAWLFSVLFFLLSGGFFFYFFTFTARVPMSPIHTE